MSLTRKRSVVNLLLGLGGRSLEMKIREILDLNEAFIGYKRGMCLILGKSLLAWSGTGQDRLCYDKQTTNEKNKNV